MEGLLTVPPDRGTIIGRAIWKSRYVVVGAAQREPQSPAAPSTRNQISRSSTPMALRKAYPDGVFLSIYKSKDDVDPVQQHAIATITDCQVQMLAHRKQGPVLPTLVINIVPDPATDKLRKRRSSRTAGLTATKETAPTTLFFRPGQESHALHDWAQVIHQFVQSHVPERTPLSPMTPASPTFINPFAPRPRETSESLHRPASGNPGSRPPFFSKGSNHTGSSRERPVTYSETHSLRSKPSDLSSHTSSMSPSHMVFHQNYMAMHPADLPSPATTIGDYQGEFIEGWTSAQGRSSTISSPVRTRDSIGSQIPPQPQPMVQSSSPPIPRETILDRAFQLRYIPGSEREVPGEEKLSSLARFDALMREADEKRKEREVNEARARAATMTPMATPSSTDNSGLKSAWDLDDDSDDDDDFDEEDEDEDDPAGVMEQMDLEDRFPEPPNKHIPPSAKLALEFIAGRHEAAQRPQPSPRSPPLSYNHDTLMALSNSGSSSRPQTGYSKNRRPAVAQRTHSQPQLAGLVTASTTLPQPGPPTPVVSARRDVSAPTSARPSDEAAPSPVPAAPATHRTAEKRLSTSSIKRQSFTEFTKRLSSTSSLLLGGSSRGSNSDISDAQQLQQQQVQQYSHHLHPRAAPPPPQHPQSPGPDKCGWRGSVGVFGAEGGFL
ncbi:hypothetical protein B0T16DRAFT_426832 [Cercophora newfieldiana]|uniref:Uncharacterized protein n=1 Tax=Cercophora newfieldiana TaxID=92897 RepID=A0AA40CUW3_9PEZI|nr:hypothetical protein B0T16DRAFT_426832 [Cercophora newfieldiana]